MSTAPLTSPFQHAPMRQVWTGSKSRSPDFDADFDAETGPGPDSFQVWLAALDGPPRPIRYPHESRRIMVGVDFSRASDLAVDLVAGIAATTDILVDLVHVFDGFSEAFVHGDPAILDRVDPILASVRRALRMRTLATGAQGVRCVSTSLVGAPGIELTRHAKATGADLLVLGLGTQSRGPLGWAWSVDGAVQLLRTGVWKERRSLTPSSFAGLG